MRLTERLMSAGSISEAEALNKMQKSAGLISNLITNAPTIFKVPP